MKLFRILHYELGIKKVKMEDIKQQIIKWSIYTYARLLSEQIFLPITTEDKELMYAPFHCLAQYFLSFGYVGIMYSSTVFPDSKNIVLFDKYTAELYGHIESFIVPENL